MHLTNLVFPRSRACDCAQQVLGQRLWAPRVRGFSRPLRSRPAPPAHLEAARGSARRPRGRKARPSARRSQSSWERLTGEQTSRGCEQHPERARLPWERGSMRAGERPLTSACCLQLFRDGVNGGGGGQKTKDGCSPGRFCPRSRAVTLTELNPSQCRGGGAGRRKDILTPPYARHF